MAIRNAFNQRPIQQSDRLEDILKFKSNFFFVWCFCLIAENFSGTLKGQSGLNGLIFYQFIKA